MITFYPGPSKVYPQVRHYLTDAYDSGILSANHRSSEFMQLCEKTLNLLHQKLNIPADYAVVFVSSATECWEIIAQSFTRQQSFHYYNGAFGQKWFEYAQKLVPAATGYQFPIDQDAVAQAGHDIPHNSPLLCLTHNETSNGTQLSSAFMEWIRHANPDSLIAVDATSSLGGADLRINQADIWFASVQKCLGLPAGMALLVVSPRALAVAKELNNNRFYNSFLFMQQNMEKLQTHYTPNVLAIYLLCRVLEQVEPIEVIASRIHQQAAEWYAFFENHSVLNPLVAHTSVRSDTVIAVSATEEIVSLAKQKARQAGIILGNGYGNWKNTTFRIANFPAIDEAEIEKLKAFLNVTFSG